MPQAMMKAIVYDRYGGPEDLYVADVPVPEPSKGQVRVRVLTCAVNLSDWEYLIGSPFYARMVGGLRRPKQRVLGSDIVGVVDKLGPGVSEPALGQRVTGDFVMIRGGFAKYACVPANELVAVPEELSDEIAACLPQAGGIAVAATDGLTNGSTLLINGAGGGSGTMALQLAKAAGARVTVVDNGGKIEWLKSLGADEAIDYRETDFTKTGGRWDRIVDMVATRGPGRVAKALSPGGVYWVLGGEVRVLLSLLIGGLRFRLGGKRISMLVVPAGRDLTERVIQMVVDGNMAPHLEAVMPLSSAPEALRATGNGEVKGKLVIRL